MGGPGGHGIEIRASRWTPNQAFHGMLSTYTDPAGKLQELQIRLPLENLGYQSPVQFGLFGSVGTYVLHLDATTGRIDLPITLTQEVVDLQAAGAKYCTAQLNEPALVFGVDRQSVHPGDPLTILVDDYHAACTHDVLTLAGIASVDTGKFTRASGPRVSAVPPSTVQWQLPADAPAGRYIALFWFPSAWRELQLTITK